MSGVGSGAGSVSRRGLLAGVVGGFAVGAIPTLAGCAASPVHRLKMACGEAGGIYLQFGELLSAAVDRRASGGVWGSARVAAQLEPLTTNGSAENLQLLQDGEADLAIALADIVREHENARLADGRRAAGGRTNVAIGRVYQNYLQCAVLADGPLRGLSDLRGKVVSTGASGSGSSFTTRRVLDLAGLGEADGGPRQVEHTLEDGLRELRLGRIDAMFWSGGVSTPKIEEFSAEVPLRLFDLSTAAGALEAEYPLVYLKSTIPANVYGSTVPTPTLGIPNLLLASPDLPDDIARLIVDALVFDARRLVPKGSVGAQFLTPVSLIDTGAVPLHPAARDRYREVYG
ncbi:TAXI family TRAP transporter solute-binding subunit [Leucobacter coleopterorum]|uniref:TAXI family TRAP transporter solute-binding subunit n=1 Tax=Leucobacter coleopterorum TaxID=2714933 RepID=A0ABX6JTW6_9MICO|nr:TAXI family TRAP transporter solute-binding subunit [Leucobacter coleopterorum]QIM17724.1 TAXI family TRAP transporter solute-binding subunit [Leucobacter coleopterorum]